MHVATSPAFKENAHRALADAGLQKALARSGPSFIARRAAAVAALPEFEQLRDIARDIKNHTLANLDFYLEAYEAKVLEAGGKVHWCADAEEARDAVLAICQAAGARTVTKGKSMIGEEIAINDHLEQHGITPVETDLGEYIIQLRHEAAQPHHRAGVPSQPGGLGGGVPQSPHRPASRPRVQRTPRHPDRGPHASCAQNSSPPMSASPAPTS